MKRLDRLTATLLLVAGLGSLALTLLAFVVHIPVRDGSHNLVRTASGGYVEVPLVYARPIFRNTVFLSCLSFVSAFF